MMEPAQEHAVRDRRGPAVGLVLGVVHLACRGGLVAPPGPLAVLVPQVTALRIPAGMVSAYPMSSGRLGPPMRAPSCRRRRKDASPPARTAGPRPSR
jgi:hypothetical protein